MAELIKLTPKEVQELFDIDWLAPNTKEEYNFLTDYFGYTKRTFTPLQEILSTTL